LEEYRNGLERYQEHALLGKDEIHAGKVRLVQAWIEIHREELMADWQLAVNGEEAFKIEPLK
jgi:hypothetical protein